MMGWIRSHVGEGVRLRLVYSGLVRSGRGSRALALFVYRSGVSVNRRRAMSANRGDRD